MEDRVGRSQGTRSGVAEEEELELELESETKLGGYGKVLVNEVSGVRVPRIQKSASNSLRSGSRVKLKDKVEDCDQNIKMAQRRVEMQDILISDHSVVNHTEAQSLGRFRDCKF